LENIGVCAGFEPKKLTGCESERMTIGDVKRSPICHEYKMILKL